MKLRIARKIIKAVCLGNARNRYGRQYSAFQILKAALRVFERPMVAVLDYRNDPWDSYMLNALRGVSNHGRALAISKRTAVLEMRGRIYDLKRRADGRQEMVERKPSPRPLFQDEVTYFNRIRAVPPAPESWR